MPYVTEDLWQRLPRGLDVPVSTIMLSKYPQSQPERRDDVVEEEMEFVLRIVSRLRNARTGTLLLCRDSFSLSLRHDYEP